MASDGDGGSRPARELERAYGTAGTVGAASVRVGRCPRGAAVSWPADSQSQFKAAVDNDDVAALEEVMRQWPLKDYGMAAMLRAAAANWRLKDIPTRLRLALGKDGGMTALLSVAAEKGRVNVARFALDSGADPNGYLSAKKMANPLTSATFAGHPAVVKLLLARGARDVEHKDDGSEILDCALAVAVQYRHADCLRAFMDGALGPAAGIHDDLCPE